MSEIQAADGTQLLLIRHGETQWNLDHRVQGHLDVELTARGIEQARRLAASLEHEPIGAIYSSDLLRARETAEILAAGKLPVRLDPRLREAAFGLFEGLTAGEIEARYPEEFRLWRYGAVRNRPPGGETLEDLEERCMNALRAIVSLHPGEAVAVVCHGGPVRVMVCGLLGLSLVVYPRLRVENTALTRILFTTRGPILAAFNDVAHLRATASLPGHSGWEER